MSIDPVLKYPANTSSSSSPAFGSGAVRTADEEEAHYQQLELEYSQRWQPPHLYYYTDWIRQKEKYESLRAEYLSVLERWPWWAAKIANVEQQMETVREAIKLVSSHAKRYEKRLKAREAAGLPVDDPPHPVTLEEARRLAKEATDKAAQQQQTS